jgi:hypothetical protein
MLCICAILAWSPYATSLWPLPPAQATALAQSSKQQGDDLESSSEAKRQFLEGRYPELKKVLREFIEEADEWEMVFWLQWAGRLSLLLVGTGAWVLLMVRGGRWWMAVVASTIALWLNQAVFHASTYSYFVGAWTEGHSGFRYLPLSMAAPILFLDFLLPLVLAACTVVAVRWRVRVQTGGYRTHAL